MELNLMVVIEEKLIRYPYSDCICLCNIAVRFGIANTLE